MRLGGHCPGCGGGNAPCAIARCAMPRGVSYCDECPEYPCAKYDHLTDYDSFLICRFRVQDMKRAREMGMDAYMEEMRGRMDVLDFLLKNANDGRKKSFFVAAACLLPMEELRAGAQSVAEPDLSLQARAERATQCFNEAAARLGVELKFKRKPAKKK